MGIILCCASFKTINNAAECQKYTHNQNEYFLTAIPQGFTVYADFDNTVYGWFHKYSSYARVLFKPENKYMNNGHFNEG